MYMYPRRFRLWQRRDQELAATLSIPSHTAFIASRLPDRGYLTQPAAFFGLRRLRGIFLSHQYLMADFLSETRRTCSSNLLLPPLNVLRRQERRRQRIGHPHCRLVQGLASHPTQKSQGL